MKPDWESNLTTVQICQCSNLNQLKINYLFGDPILFKVQV